MARDDRKPQRSEPSPAELDDPSIPVLTERLTLPPLDIDFTLPPALTQPPPPPAPVPAPSRTPTPIHGLEAEAAAPESLAPTRPAEPNWAQLEAELRESVLRELSMRLPQNVEQIVREKMQPGIQAALDRLAGETRIAIAASLRDIVDRAVKVEIERLRAQRR